MEIYIFKINIHYKLFCIDVFGMIYKQINLHFC